MSIPSSPSPAPSRTPADEQAVRVRAPLWLAHHRRDQLHRCFKLPLGGARQLAVCARCLGLYPALLATLALQLHVLSRPGRAGAIDWWIAIGGALPALVDWGSGQLGRRGNNLCRLLSGALLGVALGRSLLLHFQDPWCEVLWVQLFVLGAGALAFTVVGRLQVPGLD